jgi:integrase
LADTKNNNPIVLPLNDQLMQVVQRRRAAAPSSYLFPNSRGGKITDRPEKAIRALRELAGFHFIAHDLRRTFRSTAASLNISLKTAAMLVNHKVKGELALDLSYVQVSDEELLRASNRIAAEIVRQGSAGASNVLPFGATA